MTDNLPTSEGIPDAADPAESEQLEHSGRLAESMVGINNYGSLLSDEDIANKRHRSYVGGKWGTIGPRQLEYLIEQGLKPSDRLLDIGCGAMRGGIHFARYLDANHYFGTDINERLIDAALQVEIPEAGLSDKVSAANFQVTDVFAADFGVQFDYALAQSVFSHLPLNHIRLCLAQTAKVMAPGGRFYATFFRAPDDLDYALPQRQPRHTTYPLKDPFHYRVNELEWASTVGPWDFTYIGDWHHPRGQEMALFTRKDETATNEKGRRKRFSR